LAIRLQARRPASAYRSHRLSLVGRVSRQPQTSSLLPHARGTPAGAHRIDEKLEQLIAEIIRGVYLRKVRARKEEVVRRVGLRCSAEGLRQPSRKAILARVRALDARRVAKARLQSSEAAAPRFRGRIGLTGHLMSSRSTTPASM